eukprot:2465112-Amphidinium_carterae.1
MAAGEPAAADAAPPEAVPPPPEAVPRYGPWGAFRLGRKQPGPKLPHGGIEAICPLHMKNTRTACKKFFRLANSEESTVQDAIHKAKFWCLQGQHVQRQYQH